MRVIVIVVIVVVTGGKQSQLLAFALGLGWSLTITATQQEMGLTWQNMIQPKSKVMGFDLKVINLVHSVKPFSCEECGKVNLRKNILKRHMTDIHCVVKPFAVKNVQK